MAEEFERSDVVAEVEITSPEVRADNAMGGFKYQVNTIRAWKSDGHTFLEVYTSGDDICRPRMRAGEHWVVFGQRWSPPRNMELRVPLCSTAFPLKHPNARVQEAIDLDLEWLDQHAPNPSLQRSAASGAR